MKWRKKRDLKRYGDIHLLKELMPDYSPWRFAMKYGLIVLSIGMLILALARPQFGSKLESVKREGVELVICLDVSNSMLSEDVVPSRMDKAKQILSRLFDGLNNDKTGLVVFAGEAFTQLPITSDYLSAKMFLNSINPGMISQQGTAIGGAIRQAMRSFTPDESSTKAILIITDGENHEDDAVGVAKEASEKGVEVSVMGVGLSKGSPIPVGGNDHSYRKDKTGKVIITKLNEEMCQEIAQAGKGIYVRADNSNSAQKVISKHISQMSKGEVESKVYSEYDEQFQLFVGMALVLLLIEYFLMERKNSLFKNIKLFPPSIREKTFLILIFLISSFVGINAQKAERSHIRTGNRLYEKALKDTTKANEEQLAKTEIEYRKALEVNQRSIPAIFNLANTLYKQGKFDQAQKQYENVITNTEDKKIKASSYHNMGNIAMQAQQYDKAVASYRESLRNNPTDNETRYNLAVAQKQLQQQQNQQNQQQQQDQQQQQEQEKKQEEQQQQEDQQQQQEQQSQQQEQPQPQEQEQEDKMSKENAQQILDAFLQDEKDTQEKVRKMQTPPQRKVDKDW